MRRCHANRKHKFVMAKEKEGTISKSLKDANETW